MRFKRAKGAALLVVFLTLGNPAVNSTPLRCGVVVIGSGETGAIDYHLGRDYDLAALKREFNQIAFR